MLPDRYTVENFKRAIRNPEKFREEIQRLPMTFHSIVQSVWAGMNGYGERDAILVKDADWDNLIVIDACRADLFEETVDLSRFDSYERVISIDSNTTPWTIKNFKGDGFGDTVYVTGNPSASKQIPNEFHDFIEVWTDAESVDYDTGTILAEPVAEYAKEASNNYPNKRLVVHFVQPHQPFVNVPEKAYRSRWTPGAGVEVEIGGSQDPPNSPWEAIEMGIETVEEVWEDYRGNLEYVMDPVFDLIQSLDGKTVVTSDHGNMLGERTVTGKRIYGHPGGLRTRELVEVPWAEISTGERKTVTDDGVHSSGSIDSEFIKERLAALGYHE